ncbi:MAG TPA: energy transducer TonB [Terriglobia bacterium]|nr:energy transducer TonB [Terriglobia bacterium]
MNTIDEIREALLGTPVPANGNGHNGTGSAPPPAKRPPKAEDQVFSEACTALSRGRVPGRGLLYSFLVHEIVIFALLMSTRFHIPMQKKSVPAADEPLYIDAELLKQMLPPVGGGSKGAPEGKKKASPGHKGEEAAPGSEGHKGFMYPGPQPVASKPPAPDNPIQTIRQPDLVKPPPVQVPLKVPNIVKVAAPRMPEAPKLQGSVKALELPVNVPAAPPPPPEVKPKMDLPPPRPELAALPTDARKDLAQAAPKLDAPKPKNPDVGTEQQNLAVLSPVAPPRSLINQVPMGEARGEFAIGPEQNKSKLSEAGSGTGNAPGAGAAKTPSNAAGAGSSAVGNGHGTDPNASAEGGKGAGAGSAKGTGLGGNGSGSGSGGSGAGRGTGSGAGLGAGHGPFAGLSIMGGTGAAGSIPRDTNIRVMFGPDRPYAYGMTVEAEGRAGGGLRDFGVFHDEAVYTVYVDMSKPNDPTVPWTLEYAALERPGSASTLTLGGDGSKPEQHVMPPLPSSKEDPKLPADLVKQYPGRVLVVYAEISPEGKLTKMHVLDSPDIELSQLVLQALAKWVFKPALLNGKAVAVQALFGVPLAPPEKPLNRKPSAPVETVEHHAPAPPPIQHVPAPPPLQHVAAPPPLKHVAAPPPLHKDSSNEVREITVK